MNVSKYCSIWSISQVINPGSVTWNITVLYNGTPTKNEISFFLAEESVHLYVVFNDGIKMKYFQSKRSFYKFQE